MKEMKEMKEMRTPSNNQLNLLVLQGGISDELIAMLRASVTST